MSLLTKASFIESIQIHSKAIRIPSQFHPFTAPQWASTYFHEDKIPRYKLSLANLPTPIDQIFPCPDSFLTGHILNSFKEFNTTLLVKRDDCSSGVELGGNKIRKLEFLLADALEKKAKKIVTIGGEQSNHCRATAAACRMIGIEPHLILRTKRANNVKKKKSEKDQLHENDSFGYTGNILFDRIVDSHIYTVTPGEYGRFGSNMLIDRLCSALQEKEEGSVYPIPVGGSNALGTWGYIAGVNEVLDQLKDYDNMVDHIVFACGSGGTAAGITLGIGLAYNQGMIKKKPQLHAVGVCDNPEIFYEEIRNISNEMGLDISSHGSSNITQWIKDHVQIYQGKGLGYAISTPQEMAFCAQFAKETGIVVDPVYTGKALNHFVSVVMESDKELFRNSTVLFWHTGGSLGLYDKIDTLSRTASQVKRFDVYGNNKPI